MFLQLPTLSTVQTLARCSGLLLTLFASAAAAEPSSASSSPLPGYEIIHLGRGPFNRLDFAATIDGVKGVMAVDTGASSTLLNDVKYGFLLKNGVERPAKVPARGRMNESTVPVAMGADMQLGSFHAHNVPFLLVPRRNLHDALTSDVDDRQYDGYLGENILRSFNAVIDCARLRLFLNTDPAHKVSMDHGLTQNGWTRIPMSNVQLDFSVPCTLAGHPYRLIVDTGSPFTILEEGILSKEQIKRREIPFRAGVIGYHPTVQSLADLDSLSIGDFTATGIHPLSDPALQRVLTLNNASPGQAPIAGLLGGDILAANGAMIDIGTHNLYLKHTGASAPANPN